MSIKEEIEEYKKFLEMAKVPQVKKFLQEKIAERSALIQDEKPKESVKVPKSYAVLDKMSYYQDNKTITILFDLPVQGGWKIEAKEVRDRSFRVVLSNGKFYIAGVTSLFDDIIPDKTSVRISKSGKRLNVKCYKKDPKNWTKLREEKKSLDKKSKKSDDDSIDDKDPMGSLMDLMKKMYDEGDEETKKMITKAWAESLEKKNKGEEL